MGHTEVAASLASLMHYPATWWEMQWPLLRGDVDCGQAFLGRDTQGCPDPLAHHNGDVLDWPLEGVAANWSIAWLRVTWPWFCICIIRHRGGPQVASLCFGMEGETQDDSKEPAVVLRLMFSDCYLLNEQLQSCWIFSRLFVVAVVGCWLLNGKNAYYMGRYLARNYQLF